MPRWEMPLDPSCPEVDRYTSALFNDPMTIAMGAPTDDIMHFWSQKHRANCDRCKEYGAANVEAEY